MRKVGICNLNGTAIKYGTNINSYEIIQLSKQLNLLGNIEATVINYDNIEDDFITCSIYSDAFDINMFDDIIIMGSTANFFGGVCNQATIDIYKQLAKFNNKLYYLFNDYRLPFRQLWKNIEKRSWNTCKKEDVFINRPITILSQFRDLESARKVNSSPEVVIEDVVFYDFSKWILFDYKNKLIDNQHTYDLIYGGSFRGGNREKKFIDYFFDKDINIALYGSLSLKNFKDIKYNKAPQFLGRSNSSDCIKMNSLGTATVICGEKHYNNNTITIRVYESLLANCITFIDNDFDTNKFLGLHDFVYINSGQELEKKLKTVLSDKSLYDSIIDKQHCVLEAASKTNIAAELASILGV